MNKNLCLNNSERDWLLKVRSIIKDPLPKILTPPNDEIWYLSSDENIVVLAKTEDGETFIPLSDEEYISIFGANLISNTYENGKGIIKFDGEVTKVGDDIENPGEGIIGGFIGNDKLTTITLPDSVTSIGYAAFFGCTGLTSITISNTTPPTLGTEAFDHTNNSPIYVPSESVDTYKSADNWSTYASRIQAIQ